MRIDPRDTRNTASNSCGSIHIWYIFLLTFRRYPTFHTLTSVGRKKCFQYVKRMFLLFLAMMKFCSTNRLFNIPLYFKVLHFSYRFNLCVMWRVPICLFFHCNFCWSTLMSETNVSWRFVFVFMNNLFVDKKIHNIQVNNTTSVCNIQNKWKHKNKIMHTHTHTHTHTQTRILSFNL